VILAGDELRDARGAGGRLLRALPRFPAFGAQHGRIRRDARREVLRIARGGDELEPAAIHGDLWEQRAQTAGTIAAGLEASLTEPFAELEGEGRQLQGCPNMGPRLPETGLGNIPHVG
jgi:hypothetical protein